MQFIILIIDGATRPPVLTTHRTASNRSFLFRSQMALQDDRQEPRFDPEIDFLRLPLQELIQLRSLSST